jgi:hypothetical protein
MDDAEFQQRVSELDAAVTKDDAKLLIYVEDDEEGACEIIGNRKGYFRAGIEMLRAALLPLGQNQFITPIDFSYLGVQRSLLVKRLIRQEDVEAALPPAKTASWKDKPAGVGCLTLVIFVFICAVTGFGELMAWLFRK